MSIDDRGRVFVELLLVVIFFVFAMDRITPWETRAATLINAIEQRQIAHHEMAPGTGTQLGRAQPAAIRENTTTPHRPQVTNVGVQDSNVEPRPASRIRPWIASAE